MHKLLRIATFPRTLWADRALAGWATGGQRRVGYLGWLNRGNLGDELMYGVHRSLLGESVILPLALHEPGRALHRALKTNVHTVLVGGGTLLLSDVWGERLQRILDSVSFDRLVIFGAGANELEVGRRSGLVTDEGLSRWVDLLGAATFVGVRGPRSRATLEELGVSSVVVGDPALCGPIPAPSELGDAEGHQVIALNLTGVGDAEKTAVALRPHVAHAVAGWVRQGYKCVAFEMDRGDLAATRKHLAQAGLTEGDYSRVRSRSAVLSLLSSASLVVAERLHGAVIAANYGRPFIHLAYKPKSMDFLESVDAASFGLVDATNDASRIVSLGEKLMSGGRSELLEAPWKAIDARKKQFRELYSSVMLSR